MAKTHPRRGPGYGPTSPGFGRIYRPGRAFPCLSPRSEPASLSLTPSGWFAIFDRLHGTGRGQIQLLMGHARLPLVRTGTLGEAAGRKALLAGEDEFEGLAVALDMATVVMAADHQHGGIGKAGKQLVSCLDRLGRVGIGG